MRSTKALLVAALGALATMDRRTAFVDEAPDPFAGLRRDGWDISKVRTVRREQHHYATPTRPSKNKRKMIKASKRKNRG